MTKTQALGVAQSLRDSSGDQMMQAAETLQGEVRHFSVVRAETDGGPPTAGIFVIACPRLARIVTAVIQTASEALDGENPPVDFFFDE